MGSSLKQQAYQHIKGLISEGSLSGGDKLSPSEIGKEIGVSHIPVREAISQLESEGFVVKVDRQGSFVRKVARREIEDLIGLREMLEVASIGKAARRIGSKELDEVEECLRELRTIVDAIRKVEESRAEDDSAVVPLLGRWMLVDLAFHLLLLQAAGNREVVKLIADKQIMIQMFGRRTDSPEAWSHSLADWYAANYQVHEEIFTAVRQRDAKAARRTMNDHNRRARENLLARLDWLEKQEAKESPHSREFPESIQQLVGEMQRSFLEETS